MADVTVVSKPYGWRCHTGTTIASVTDKKIRIRCISCWGVANDTALFTDYDGSVIAKVTIAVTAQSQNLDMKDMPVDGIRVTHSASTIESRIVVV